MNRIIVVVLLLAACGKDAATNVCLEEFRELQKLTDADAQRRATVYQTCAIPCEKTKDAEACDAFATITRMICEKEGPEACKQLCEGTNNKKNETACGVVFVPK